MSNTTRQERLGYARQILGYLEQEEIKNKIIEMGKNCYRDMLLGNPCSGFKRGVYVDYTGDVSEYTLSQNSQSMWSWEGKEVSVVNYAIQSSADYEINADDVEDLLIKKGEIEQYTEWYATNHEEEYTRTGDVSYYNGHLLDYSPSYYHELETEYVEMDVEEYGEESVTTRINESIADMLDYIRHLEGLED